MRFQFLHGDRKPALVLVPNEHVEREIQSEILGREWVGDAKSVFRKKFTGDAFVSANMRDVLNNMTSESKKTRVCKHIWKQRVAPHFELLTHTRFDKLVLDILSDEEIVERFSNRVIVVDECQRGRKMKRFYQALERVARLARNIVLLLLTATPMIESAEEICPLVNLMLLSEGETELLDENTVRAFVRNPDDIEARDKICRAIRGRVSYVRGMDPRSYPMREDHGINLFPELGDHRVWPCYLQGPQLQAFLEAQMRQFVPNAEAGERCDLWNDTREVGRILLTPSMGKWSSARHEEWTGNPNAPEWQMENIRDYSAKLYTVKRVSETLSHIGGSYLVFSSSVETGVKPVATFLRANEVAPWGSTAPAAPAQQKQRRRMVLKRGRSKSRNNSASHRNKSQKRPRHNIADAAAAAEKTADTIAVRYVNISGGVSVGKAKDAIKVLKSDANYLGELARWILGSPKISTGITLRHVSIVFLLEPGWTVGQDEQLIGRTTRHESHLHHSSLVTDNNQVVHVFRLCARFRDADLEALPDKAFVARFRSWVVFNQETLRARGFLYRHPNTGREHFLTIDERTVFVSMQRDKEIALVNTLLKEYSLPLNLEQNYFAEDGLRHTFTRLYEYQEQPPRVPVPDENNPSHPKDVPNRPLYQQQDTTFRSFGTWFRLMLGKHAWCFFFFSQS
jgi:hypothetical protein